MANLHDMGVDGSSILSPQHKNRWKLRFTNLGGGDGEILRLQAIQADRPKLAFEKITLDRYNTRAYIAGKYTWETVNFTFEADTGGLVSDAIKAQLERQQNIIDFGSAPTMPAAVSGQDYKFAVKMEQFSGQEQALEFWRLDGCWIENADWGDWDYAASETVKITLTISFDHARLTSRGAHRYDRALGGIAP